MPCVYQTIEKAHLIKSILKFHIGIEEQSVYCWSFRKKETKKPNFYMYRICLREEIKCEHLKFQINMVVFWRPRS
jgi:hypothetical protein